MDTDNPEEENSTPEELKCYIFMKYENFVKVIENGHLKLVLPSETNDPYEFRPITPNEPEEKKQEAIKQYKDEISKYGFLSFSSNPYSSVMWAHYSDNHKDLCLEFTLIIKNKIKIKDCNKYIYVIDNKCLNHSSYVLGHNIHIFDVIYSSKRPNSGLQGDIDQFRQIDRQDSPTREFQILNFRLAHKGLSWRYEQERRIFLLLECHDIHNNAYFTNIYNKAITKVILGIKCPIEEWRIQHMLQQFKETNGYKEMPKVVRAQFSADDYKVVVPD